MNLWWCGWLALLAGGTGGARAALAASVPAQFGVPSPAAVAIPADLSVQCDRADARYRCGEQVRFMIALHDATAAVHEVDVVVSQDGLHPQPVQHVQLKGRPVDVTAQLAIPGMLQCRAAFKRPDGSTVVALAAAAIAPEKLAASRPPPADFEAYWSAQKRRLATVPLNLSLTAVPSPDPAVACFEVRADAVTAPVTGYLTRPAAARPGTLPAILILPGAGVASASLSDSVRWAREGLVALTINAHGLPNGQPRNYYERLYQGPLKDYWFQGRESRDQFYFRDVFLRVVRAIDVLAAQPQWDGRTMVAHGYSQGGGLALVAAALDPRVTFYAAGIPALCDHTGFLAGRANGWPKVLVPVDATGRPDERVLATAGYYDVVNFARLVRVAGVVSVGYIDTACPPSSVYVAFNTLQAPKRLLTYPRLGHAHPAEMEAAMRADILEHVRPRATTGPRF